MNPKLDIIIFGASGDLAKKKVFPAFFSLFSRGLLPDDVKFYGFARSDMTQQEFIDKITANLTCRYTPEKSCQQEMDNFLSRCVYVRGDYQADDAYQNLLNILNDANNNQKVDRLFYLAVPPQLFAPITSYLGKNGLTFSDDAEIWSRVIIEKPFGRNRTSSDALMTELQKVFTEKQTYRIDHYLGKEIVQNIMVFRFSNIVFQPIWNSKYMEKIEILWAEDQGIDERGGYFDSYGIIRDVIQNHLFQVLSLITMDEPDSLDANDISDKKVDVLRHIKPVNLEDVVVGQYAGSKMHGARVSSYLDDPTVPDDSITPTFAFIKLKIDNERWRNMPIEITAGKGLKERKAEVKISFKKPCGNIFCKMNNCQLANELEIRIQPDEGFNFLIATKEPGSKMELMSKKLDLSYNTAFPDDTLPDAYENLLLDAIIGDKTLFIRNDELEIAWDILTPVLEQLETENIKPEPYEFGSRGPDVERYEKEHCFNKKSKKDEQ